MEQLLRAQIELTRSSWNFYAVWFRICGFPTVFLTTRAERAVTEIKESLNGGHSVIIVDFNRR
jgi:hypothetical protein